jgi:hypothetical protein
MTSRPGPSCSVVESVGTAPPDELQVQQDAHMEERRVPGADRRSDHERARTSLGGRAWRSVCGRS